MATIRKKHVRHALFRTTGCSKHYHAVCGKVIDFATNAHPGYKDKIAMQGEQVTCKECLKGLSSIKP